MLAQTAIMSVLNLLYTNKFVLENTKENCIPKVHHETSTVCFKVPQKEQFVLFRTYYQNLLTNSVLSQMKISQIMKKVVELLSLLA